jgi:peptide/nickel transport system substrate-binding protein
MKTKLVVTAICASMLVFALFSSLQVIPTLAQDEPVYGGTITVARYEDTQTLNPILAPGITALETCGLIFDGLLRLDEDGVPQLHLATDYDISTDGKTYTFTLRDNVTFHDGEPLTAEDVKFTFEQALNESVAFIYAAYYSALEEVVVIDDKTIEFRLSEENGPFISWMNLPIIPKHVFTHDGRVDLNNDPANADPIGSGPFKFVSWVKDDKIVLEANEDYWGGRPYLDEVVIRVITDTATMAVALENGEIDFARDITFTDADRLDGHANITLLIGPPNYIKGLRGCFRWSYFNKTNPNSLALRQAIGYAIDREGISDSIYFGLGMSAHSPIPSGFTFWHNGEMDTGIFTYDPDKANQILDPIYPKDIDGWRFEMELAGSTEDRELLEIVESNLEDVGIKINLWIGEKSAYWAKISGAPYELGTWSWVAVPDPAWIQVAYANWTTSSYTLMASGLPNMTGNYWSSGNATELYSLLKSGETLSDPDERQAAYYRIQEIVGYEDPFIIFLNYKPWPHAYRSDLRGFTAVPMMLYETTLSNSLPKVWRVQETQPEDMTMIYIIIAVVVIVVVVGVAAYFLRKRGSA